jgi:hypothetical protein
MLPYEEPSFAIGPEADWVIMDAFTEAHDITERIAEIEAGRLASMEHRNKVTRRQIEDVTQWGKEVGTGYFNKFRKQLSRSTCRSAVHSPRFSEDSHYTDEDEPLEKPRTPFCDANTSFPTTNPNDGGLSSHGYDKFVFGYNQNAGTMRA